MPLVLERTWNEILKASRKLINPALINNVSFFISFFRYKQAQKIRPRLCSKEPILKGQATKPKSKLPRLTPNPCIARAKGQSSWDEGHG